MQMLAPTAGIYTNALLTAVHREAITALMCAATLYHGKNLNKVLRLDSQYLDILFYLVQLFAFRTPICFPSHTQQQKQHRKQSSILWATEVKTVGHLLGVCYGDR